MKSLSHTFTTNVARADCSSSWSKSSLFY